MARLREVKLRHGRYYLDRLREFYRLYEKGGETRETTLCRLSEERPQILAAQEWAATNQEVNVLAAELCSQFCEIDQAFLDTILSPAERGFWFEAAVRAARRLHRPELVKQHLLGAAFAALDRSDTVMAIQLSEEALELVAPGVANEPHLRLLARAYDRQGDVEKATALIERIREDSALPRDNDSQLVASIESAAGQANAGHRHEAVAALVGLLSENGESIGWRFERDIVTMIGVCCSALGQLRRATAFFERAYQLSRDAGDLSGEAQVLGYMGALNDFAGESGTAELQYNSSIEILRAREESNALADALWGLAVVLDRMGRHEEADMHIEECHRLWHESHDIRALQAREQMAIRTAPMQFDTYGCWGNEKWLIEAGQRRDGVFLHVTQKDDVPVAPAILSIDMEGVRPDQLRDDISGLIGREIEAIRSRRRVFRADMAARLARVLGASSADDQIVAVCSGLRRPPTHG